ncbi:MAG: 4-hydroxyphenylacetate 3-hydroxylase [Actinomycetota bacterium]|nr:4-hydroxyphenylacetate 3-hydroxylase [Actinomycetota bacterium]
MRSGKDYLEALKDDRTVYVYGETVEDITEHPAFSGVASTVASMYDFASDPQNGMTFRAPETGNPANKAFMIPRSKEDLGERRRAISRWAGISKGFLGRSPDHVAGFLAGFASGPSVFDRNGRELGRHVTDFYRRLLDEDLFVTYVIIPPQVSRATTAHGWEGELIQVGVAEERPEGIVVRGSQMLGTSSAVSDYLFVSCIKPLQPEDSDHALSFVVPIGARGLKLYCRRPFAMDQPSRFDYPMSTRFDETDALVVFDDVFVPWEEVFVYRDVEGIRAQFFQTAAHVLGNNQAQVRLVNKMQFIIGVARKIAQVNQIDAIPSVQEKLGDLASLAAIVEGMVLASEATAVEDGFGVMKPNPRFLYGAMGLQAETYPRALHLLRELAGGGVMQLPSSYRELVSEETRGDMERYVQSPGYPTEERVKLFKLAWDLVGSEFGGRHHQYEMFYAGAPFVAKGYAYRNYGYDEVVAEVEQFLAGYDLDSAGGGR